MLVLRPTQTKALFHPLQKKAYHIGLIGAAAKAGGAAKAAKAPRARTKAKGQRTKARNAKSCFIVVLIGLLYVLIDWLSI